jgi:hypothetical protein
MYQETEAQKCYISYLLTVTVLVTVTTYIDWVAKTTKINFLLVWRLGCLSKELAGRKEISGEGSLPPSPSMLVYAYTERATSSYKAINPVELGPHS